MTNTTGRKSRTNAPMFGLKALAEEGPGVYEAIVSVFGNVDHHGDRIHYGAFSASLDRWKAAGDPIPVIFAHQWDNLDAHVGEVLEAEEIPPGDDPRLSAVGLQDNGGLWVKFALDVDEDFAGRLAKRLDRRSIREFSFAYDILDESRDPDGANGLHEVDVIEVGPALKGANSLTRLLAAGPEDLDRPTPKAVIAEMVDDLEAIGADEVAAVLRKSRDAAGRDAKTRVEVNFEGSLEERQGAIFEAAKDWAETGDIGEGGFYWLYLEATYEDRVVVLVEGWDDPPGSGIFYELSIGEDDDGAVTVEDPREVEVAVTLAAKTFERRAAETAHRKASALRAAGAGTVRDTPIEPGPGGSGKSGSGSRDAGPGGREDEGPDGTGGSARSALSMIELAECELL